MAIISDLHSEDSVSITGSSTQQQIFDILESHGKGGDNSPTGRAKIHALNSTGLGMLECCDNYPIQCRRDSGKSAM